MYSLVFINSNLVKLKFYNVFVLKMANSQAGYTNKKGLTIYSLPVCLSASNLNESASLWLLISIHQRAPRSSSFLLFQRPSVGQYYGLIFLYCTFLMFPFSSRNAFKWAPKIGTHYKMKSNIKIILIVRLRIHKCSNIWNLPVNF